MLVWLVFFFSGIFHAETMPLLLKEEVDSIGGYGLKVGTDLRQTPLGKAGIVCRITARFT